MEYRSNLKVIESNTGTLETHNHYPPRYRNNQLIKWIGISNRRNFCGFSMF